MPTQMEAARNGQITEEMRFVADQEKIDLNTLMGRMAVGEIIIPKNKLHDIKPIGVGAGLSTKINANLGTSTDHEDIDLEIRKAKLAVELGADTVMDLSTGPKLVETRQKIMAEVPVTIGTVPIYQAAIQSVQKRGDIISMTADDIFAVLEDQAREGVDFFTVHCGVTIESVERLRSQGRLTDIVSRGGTFTTSWIMANKAENPLYEHFDRLLDLVHEYDICLSLGDGMRPGCLADATDRAQIQELIILGELTKRAWEKGVQVMVEGPGHVPLNQIQTNMQIQKKLCQNAPFYVLGPLVTDIAPGYDHITSAIGGAIAASAGADFLCYVTPGEHLRLPDLEDVRQGVIASKIAAHAADIVKGIPGAMDRDIVMAKARKSLDWDAQMAVSLDPERATAMRAEVKPAQDEVCSMCGDYCAIKLLRESM